MNTPRCGVGDKIGLVEGREGRRRSKRYVHQGSVWKVRRLTYRITKYPSDSRLKKREVDSQVKQAFQVWQDVSDLKFEKKDSGSVHIEIRFEKGAHGDGDAFDGRGGTLAHAFFPIYGGDAHFDDQEYWTIEDFKGTNLLQTAAHEFGHSLGLSHSRDRGALMAPFYRGFQPNFKLHSDDIAGIQALYGKNTDDDDDVNEFPSTGVDSGEDDDDRDVDNQSLCNDGKFDAIVGTEDGSYYVFKGDEYYLLTKDSIAPGYPKKIRDGWQGLPDDIDAAVTWPGNGKTYFFKGSRYWRFDNQIPSSGYPKSIDKNFPGIPDNLDAAFVWGGNGKIYFFKGRRYWRFDPDDSNRPVSRFYPKDIKLWDLPSNIDGAVQWSNQYTYFFHDGNYYRFNDMRFSIDKGDPNFPRPAGPWWFGCSSRPLTNGDGFETRSFVKEQVPIVRTEYDEAGTEQLDSSPLDGLDDFLDAPFQDPFFDK